MLKVEKGFDVERVSLIVTLRCNLHCKLCVERIPDYAAPSHPDTKLLLETIDRLFRMDLRINHFGLSGGEPLIRKDLPQLLDHLLRWKDNIGLLDVVTNGTILPSQALLDSALRWGQQVRFVIDDYGRALSKQAGAMAELLRQNHVSCKINDYDKELHCSGWVDFGDFSKRGGEAFASALYAKCNFPAALSLCCEIVDGRIDPCSRSRQCIERGIPIPKAEWIDLWDDTESIDQKRQRLLAWYRLKSLTACMYCGGMCDDSVRYMPAEQLKRGEENVIFR